MKKTFLIPAIAAALALTACQSAEQKATAQAAKMAELATCPAAETLTDISAYSADGLPDASLDAAAWHEANGKRDGVKTTESGLQYTVVKSGNPAGPSPVGSQMISVNYHGFFPNGDKFDSSYDRGQPTEFPANRVIKGWIEGLGMMKPCDAWTIYIPGDLAYGPRGRDGIPPNATLLFYVQLLGVEQ